MANNEGKLIIDVLRDIGEPATVAKIVSRIEGAAGAKVPRHEIQECVEETLEAGIRYGFLHRKNRKYYAAPVDEEAPVSDEAPESEDESDPGNSETEVTDMEDRARRRRRGRRSRSRRRRSRSRRRR